MQATIRLALLGSLLGLSSGCGLLYDPCDDLEEQLCADLGEDCQTFRGVESIHASVIPLRRRKSERAQCELFGADENYESYTLPFVRYQIAVRRDPSTPAPRLPTPQHVDGLYSGVSSWLFCCFPLVFIPLMVLWSRRTRQKLAAMQAGASPAPQGPTSAPTGWEHVDSQEAVAEQVAAGALVWAALCPQGLGGLDVPENRIPLPPAAAARKQQLDAEAMAMASRGEASRYVAEPQYRGRSFVPARVLIVLETPAGERRQPVEVW